MSENSPEAFSSKDHALVITPAGCGKTELIAKAVACHNEGRQLILTHTHAGVKSLRDRLRRFGVSPRLYNIDTIAGFALKYALSFPESSGLEEFRLAEQVWNEVYEAGNRILASSVGKRVIRSSYIGLYVDEYQDCTLRQHRLIMTLAEVLPCRIVGDPLQGIFDFGDNQLVDWFRDILPNFERLPDIKTPWRWCGRNEALGNWLLEVRNRLFRGQPIALSTAPAGVEWMKLCPSNQLKACFNSLGDGQESVVAIHKWDSQAHSLAKQLGGTFTSMEEVESKDLLKWSAKLEECVGSRRAVTAIDFASRCMTKVSSELSTLRKKFESSDLEFTRKLKHTEIALALSSVAASDDMLPILRAFSLIEHIGGRVLYRRELWCDMQKAIKEYATGKYDSLQDAAWSVRDRGRIWGRQVEHRTVSRTLLIKGLEFDHAIVLNADELDAKNLYVAMTRGSKSLVVLSSEPIIQYSPPFDFSRSQAGIATQANGVAT